MPLITCNNVSKIFYHHRNSKRLLRQYVTGLVRRREADDNTSMRCVTYRSKSPKARVLASSAATGRVKARF